MKARTFTHAQKQGLNRAAAYYLEQCYKRKTAARVAEFAALLARNPEYLTRTTSSMTGVTLLEFLRAKQVEEAERLLTTTPLSVADIALHAGFGTPSTLYRCFKQLHGMPPGHFREVRKCEKN